MSRLRHGKDAAHGQEHQADAGLDQSAEHDKLNRGPAEKLERADGLRMRAGEMRQDARDEAHALSEVTKKALGRIESAMRAGNAVGRDSFALAGPGGAAARMRDEVQHAQREALAQSQANEWGRHFEQVGESLRAAARSVAFAAEAMSARHEAAVATFREELGAGLAAARKHDQPAGDLTAGEGLAQQRRREEAVAARLEAQAKQQIAEVARLRGFASDMREAILSFAREARASVAEGAGRAHEQGLQEAQERLQRFDEKWRDIVALSNLWAGRFSDVEAVQRTWERAAAGQSEDANGFKAAREKFWGSVNGQKDADAREVHRLLDKLGVEWQEGNKAPLLAVESGVREHLREAAKRGDGQLQEWVNREEMGRRITIDHVFDKAAHHGLTLDAGNLRLATHDDNSARGNKRDVTDARKLDFTRPEEELAANEERRNRAAGERAERSRETLQTMTVALAEQRLKREQERAAAQHQKVLGEAAASREANAGHLRADRRLLNGEDDGLRRERLGRRLGELDQFQNAARAQLEQLQRFEQSVHQRQQQELAEEQQRLADERGTLTAGEVLERIRGLEQRFAAERGEIEGLWSDLDARRKADERLMVDDLLRAASREAQEANVREAFARQQRAQQEQARRLEEFARKRDAHD